MGDNLTPSLWSYHTTPHSTIGYTPLKCTAPIDTRGGKHVVKQIKN
jgi:hypothetical protein